MKIEISLLGKAAQSDLQDIGRWAGEKGDHAYLVGGCVRDILLRHPSLDLDVVVEKDALTLARDIALKKKGETKLYHQFGTATVTFPNGIVLDLATARGEHYPHPGALPVVRPGSLKEDLFRRDFAVNAIAASLAPGQFGEIVDLYGGLEDLKKKKIRVLHAMSFQDDPTRILRAVRFEQRFGFRIETQTKQWINQALHAGAVSRVKLPRYFAEFRKLLSEPSPSRCLKRLKDFKALDFLEKHIVPDLRFIRRIENNITRLRKDSFYKDRDGQAVFLMALFKDAPARKREHLAQELHLTKEERSRLESLGQVPDIINRLKTKELKPSDIYEILDPLDLEIISFIQAETSVKIVFFRIDRFLKEWRMVKLHMTGHDLHKLGMKPGREVGAVLRKLLLKKIDGEIQSRTEEMALAGFWHQSIVKRGHHGEDR